jgi:hypothetical protein
MLSIGVCAESTGQQIMRQIAVPMRDHAGKHATVDHTCPYGSLAHAALGGADPIQLAAAIAFVLALGLALLPRPPSGAGSICNRPCADLPLSPESH